MNEDNKYSPNQQQPPQQQQYQQQPPQQQQYQQQPPQQQQYQQQPPQQQPPQKKSNKLPIIIGVVAVVAVVGIIVIWMLFLGGGGLVGTWDMEYIEYYDGEETIREEDIDGRIKFNRDGTGEVSIDYGWGPIQEDFEWEDLGDGRVRITSDGSSDVLNYSIRGSRLTLEDPDEDDMKMVFNRA